MSGTSISKGYALTTAVAVLLAGTAVASLAGEAGAAVKDEATAKKDRSRRVCRVVTPTSSRLTTRVCRTQAEWDETADKTGESLRKYQFDQTRQGPVPGANASPP